MHSERARARAWLIYLRVAAQEIRREKEGLGSLEPHIKERELGGEFR